MKILKNAVAGTWNPVICLSRFEPDDKELTLEIDSVVANQHLDSIRGAVVDTLNEFEISTRKNLYQKIKVHFELPI